MSFWLLFVPFYFLAGLVVWQLVDRYYWSRHPDTRSVLERQDLVDALQRAVDSINNEQRENL